MKTPIQITRTFQLTEDTYNEPTSEGGVNWVVCSSVVNRFRKKSPKAPLPTQIKVTASNVTFPGARPIFIKSTDDDSLGFNKLGCHSPSSWTWTLSQHQDENSVQGGFFNQAIKYIRDIFPNGELATASAQNPLPLFVKITVAK